MTAVKPWYLSRTIWASIVTIITGAAGLTGIPLDGFDGSAFTDTMLQAVSAVSGLIAVFGRLSAKHRIG
ncbi:hypothetical protein [Manganibacter manganicus]|uniref:Holin n=1 Tax=Manganibacter manganicus TaxID=1873176 RepID=A0A1V8RK63_9HYPH|nr:hypothetical protein [Pseudaminobacter manganicus]OQM73602.1 hypothetical protein BFN67_08420 [Pseudaminobacter manganicus]